MKRLLMGLFIFICGWFLMPSFSPVRAAQCSGSFGSCKDFTCSDGGLCPSTAVCSGAFAGMDCCYNYGPYCLSAYKCGCSSDTCTGGVPATSPSTACPCGCNSDGTCKSCCLTSNCPCGCDPAVGNTSGGVGVCKDCCLSSKCPNGCTNIDNQGGICGVACYFDELCYSDSGCNTLSSGPYAQIYKYFGCPPGPPINCSSRTLCKYGPSPLPRSISDSCVYKTSVCAVGVCHPYTCVELYNPGCVVTGGVWSWDGCNYSCAFCPDPSSSPSPGTCTAPTGLTYTRNETTGVAETLSWTRGTGGTNQYLYLDDTRSDVESGCPAGGGCSGVGCCAIKETNLGTSATSYNNLSGLEAGRLYYWRVVTYSATCQSASATDLFIHSCQLSPASLVFNLDDPATPLTSQMYSSTDILRNDFTENGGYVSLTPTSDSAYTYETSVAPLSVGAGTVTATAVLTGGVNDCSDTISATVLAAGPWWQVEDGDVHSNSGDIISNIPAAATQPYLITGLAGGLTSYTGALNIGYGTLAENNNNWQAETTYQGVQTGYAYFKRILEDDPAEVNEWNGSQPQFEADGVYSYTGNISTSGSWNVLNGEQKVILVDGDVTITNDITVANGGFLAIIASGNINIDATVTTLEGVYIADGIIDTGLSASQLNGAGIFTGWSGFSLQRDLAANGTTPAEVFSYRGDLVINAYRYLLMPHIGWKEVAP